ncbi:MAG: hypothetical protein ACNYZG_05380 [Gammaproteobacteria bacterium]
MAKSNKDRQADYREKRRCGRNNEYRINTWIDASAYGAIARLARYHHTTKRAILEKLLFDAEEHLCHSMNNDEIDQYYVTQ